MWNFIHYHLFRAIELPQTPIPATPMIHLSFPFAHYSFSHFTITQFFKTVSKLKCCCFILCCYRTASCSLPCLALYMPLLFQALLAFWAHSFSLVTGSLLYDNYFLHFWSIGWISFPLSLVAHFLANFWARTVFHFSEILDLYDQLLLRLSLNKTWVLKPSYLDLYKQLLSSLTLNQILPFYVLDPMILFMLT